MAGTLEKSSMKGPWRIDGVLAGKSCMRRANRTLSKPWQRNFSAALVLLGRRGGRRGRTHRAGTCARIKRYATHRRCQAQRYRHCRVATLAHHSFPCAHYAASVLSYNSRIYSKRVLSLRPTKDAPNPSAKSRRGPSGSFSYDDATIVVSGCRDAEDVPRSSDQMSNALNELIWNAILFELFIHLKININFLDYTFFLPFWIII